MKVGGDLDGSGKKRRRGGFGSVSADRGYLDNQKKAKREAHDIEGLQCSRHPTEVLVDNLTLSLLVVRIREFDS